MGLLSTETLRAEVNPFEECHRVRSEFIFHESLIDLPPFSHLAPGADALKSYLSDDVPAKQRADMKKIVRKLNVKDWAAVVGAFDRWPFAPEVESSFSTFALANTQCNYRSFWSRILSAETSVFRFRMTYICRGFTLYECIYSYIVRTNHPCLEWEHAGRAYHSLLALSVPRKDSWVFLQRYMSVTTVTGT